MFKMIDSSFSVNQLSIFKNLTLIMTHIAVLLSHLVSEQYHQHTIKTQNFGASFYVCDINELCLTVWDQNNLDGF